MNKQAKDFAYTVKKSRRAKRVRLAVHMDGSVVVTVPHRIPNYVADKFVKQKQDWIKKRLDTFARSKNSKIHQSTREDYIKNKEKARQVVADRVEHFNKIYGFKYNKITIRDQKTRWGSCSSKGNLNFNYKILFLSPEIRDYIIVHELCHLGEMNHSKKFWDLVSKAVPDFANIKRELRNTERGLN